MNTIENYYNCIRNSQVERYLYRYEYLHLVSAVETAALVVSVIGWPLIPLSILPIAYDLRRNLSLRRLYSLWRVGFLIALLILFFYRFSYLNYVTAVSYSTRMEGERVFSFFRPSVLSFKDIIIFIPLLVYGTWVLLLTSLLKYQVDINQLETSQHTTETCTNTMDSS
ncbi:hypothetical protein WA588_006312, partial [Blastocystis sp. NMH]